MKRIVLIAIALTVICSENGYAYDKNNDSLFYGTHLCSSYLDAYSRTTFDGTQTFKGPSDFHAIAGWINGYITSANHYLDNGKVTILANRNGIEMSINDAFKWLASWCRDNPSKSLSFGIVALSLSKN